MRTIKFRGRRLDSGEWAYGDLEHCKATNTARIHTYNGNGRYNRQFEVNPETVGQFTGLLDKNGREIYEGDILRFANSDSGVCEVRWNDSVSAFCIRFHFEHELGLKPLGSWQECERDIVIIGNIHDNPELLKGN